MEKQIKDDISKYKIGFAEVTEGKRIYTELCLERSLKDVIEFVNHLLNKDGVTSLEIEKVGR